MLRDLAARLPLLGANYRLETIFFGGGTPSLWATEELGRVLHAVLAAFADRRAPEVEVTAECNPTSLDLEKARALVWPRGENATDIFSVGNARPLDQALQHATTDMFNRLVADHGLSPTAASHLMGQVVRYDVGNVYDPAFTMVCRIEKKWLPDSTGFGG